MLRWILADLKTGRQILDLNVTSGRWERFLNAPETIEATVSLRDPANIALRLRYTAVGGRSVLAVASGETILAAGVIWDTDYDGDRRTLKLTGKGVWSYYDHRHILPVIAATTPVADFTIPDPADAKKTIPNPALSTVLNGWQLGTIAKKLVQQAHAWTGGALPIVFEADRAGTHERTYIGPEFDPVGEALERLTEVENGPDIVFQPRFTADRLGIEWVLRTGTEAAPQLVGGTVHSWAYGAPKSAISDLKVHGNASDLAGIAWLTGGRSNDEVLVARSIDNRLVNAGFPLFELLDSSHSSVEVQATLDGYAAEATRFGFGAVEEWSFQVETSIQPKLGSYWEGDFCDISFPVYGARGAAKGGADAEGYLPLEGALDEEDYGPLAIGQLDSDGYWAPQQKPAGDLIGDPYFFEGGTFRRRIVGIAGDERGLKVKIITAPVRSA